MGFRGARLASGRLYAVVPVVFAVIGGLAAASSTPSWADSGSEAATGRPSIQLEPRTAFDTAPGRSADPEVADVCAQPLALASGDLDDDGVPDLVVGCTGRGGGGAIVVYRGRGEAIYPAITSAVSSSAPFEEATGAVKLEDRADWIGAGDFDGDGRCDVAAARYGGQSLELLRGDGSGALGGARTVALPGPVLDVTSGEMDRRDGTVDLVVAVASDDGSRLLVLGSRRGTLADMSEPTAIPGKVVDMALGQLDGEAAHDLAVATDRGLMLVYGRDRRDLEARAPYRVEQAPLTSRLAALAVGDFLPGGHAELEIAAVGTDGRLYVLRKGEDTGGHARQLDRSRQSAGRAESSWSVVDTAAEVAVSRDVGLTAARVSGRSLADLVILDRDGGQIRALSAVAGSPATGSAPELMGTPTPLQLDAATRVPQRSRGLRPVASVGGSVRPELGEPAALVSGPAPLALLRMRLNSDAIDDLVVLEEGRRDPKVLLSVAEATFVVTSTADTDDGTCDADCTLREAINAANTSIGADLISFDLPGPPPYTIQPLTDLPEVTEAVTIDGTTEPDFGGTPVVVLDGVNILTAGTTNGIGLLVSGGSSTVRGLACHNFTLNSCITVWLGGGNIVEGNFLGTDATGTSVVGTLAGTNAVASSNNTFGGTTAAARNVIAGVDAPGIELREQSTDNVVRGNYFGLAPDGASELPMAGNAVVIYDSEGNTLGGSTAADRNVIAGGTDPGTVVIGIAPLDADPLTIAQDNLIQGNFLGTDATGTVGLGPLSAAIYILDAPANTVGGSAPNVIADAGLWGVAVVSAGAVGNLIDGNLIGVGADGVTALPIASDGVRLYLGAADTTISNNVIAHGLANGVGLRDDCGTGNTITANAIFGNGLLGIDIDLDGVTANDAQDTDLGANLRQNYPVLTLADGSENVVEGSLDSTPESAFTIELFASSTCDPSGYGEGERLVGSAAAVTDAAGSATFSIAAASPLADGEFVTATATDSAGNTSELSACLRVTTLLFEDGFEAGNPTAWSTWVPQS